MDRKAALADYIRKEVIRNRNANLDENEDLLSAGILDSLGILQLVAFISDAFGVDVPDEDVVYENFHSLQSIANYLKQYTQ
jgi:acyl carrier protein